MADLSLSDAQTIIEAALAHGQAAGLKPLGVVVLDARGALKAAAMQDGSSLARGDIAIGKAYGAISFGMGSRALFKRAEQQHFFIAAASHIVGGKLVPVPGGVLIRGKGKKGALMGAVGVSGDTSDNDEAAAIAGVKAAGFVADAG